MIRGFMPLGVAQPTTLAVLVLAPRCDSWLYAVRRCSAATGILGGAVHYVIRGFMPLGVAQLNLIQRATFSNR